MKKLPVIENGFYLIDSIPHNRFGKPIYTFRGAKWNYITRKFHVPITPGNQQSMKLLGYDVPDVSSIVIRQKKTGANLNIPCADKLRPYQIEGVNAIEDYGGRALLADEMGLGKSIQCIAWAMAHPEKRPMIIIGPACAKLNWATELRKWMPNEDVAVLSGTKVAIPTASIYVINYDILHHWVDDLIQIGPKLVIIDEAHRIRNWMKKKKKGDKKDKYGRKGAYTLSTDSVLRLCSGVESIIAVTGSPVINRPMDLFNALHLINPSVFPSKFEFGMRYCDAKIDKWSGAIEYKGCSRPEELNSLLNNSCMVRRLKKDVLKDLPPKQRSIILLDTDNKKEYAEIEKDVEKNPMEKLTELRKLCGLGKLNAACEWIEDFLESGQKLIVYVHHRSIGEALYNRFREISVAYSGGMSEKSRWDAVQKFQKNPEIQLFIGSIQACGEAITLTAASNVAVLEFPWTPAILSQAEDRAHRFGQTMPVNIWLLAAKDTTDEDMLEMLVGKTGMAESVLDGGMQQEQAMARILSALRSRRAKNNLRK